MTELNEYKAEEVVREKRHAEAVQFSKRRWRDLKETAEMLESALTNYSSAINPVYVETMQLIAGDESLQFRFVTNKTAPVADGNFTISFDGTTKVLRISGGLTGGAAILQHMTIGISGLSSQHKASEYKFWDIPQFKSGQLADASKKYYVYAKVSKTNESGSFMLSETAIGMDEVTGYYHFLVGILNSEYNGSRDFVKLYGFTEVLPGQITTDVIRSADGKTYFDLANGKIAGDITFTSSDGTSKGMADFASEVQDQIDGVVENWSAEGHPYIDSYPVSKWATDAEKIAHINDTYVNIEAYVDDESTPTAGHAWRWCRCAEGTTPYFEIENEVTSNDWEKIGKIDPNAPYTVVQTRRNGAMVSTMGMAFDTDIRVYSGPPVYIKVEKATGDVYIKDASGYFEGYYPVHLRFIYSGFVSVKDKDGNTINLHWHPIADSDAVRALKEAAEAKAGISDMQYLRNVFDKGSTEVSGGVVMTQVVAVKDEEGDIESILNGSENFTDTDHGKVILAGGIPARTENGDSLLANRVNDAKTRIFEDGWIDATGGKLELMEVNSLRGMVSQIDPTAYLGSEPWYIKEFYQYNGKPNSPDDILMGDSNTSPAKDPSPGSFVPGWDAEPDLAWGKEQIGRRRMFVNHKNASGFSRDYIILNAPQGNTGTTLIGLNTPYFYENGVPSKQLRIEANECVELYGYGFYKSEDKSNWEFMGWIVMNRTNLFSAFSQSLPRGMFAGLRPAFRQVTSSYETLTKYDHTIECFGDGTTINLSLPSSPEVGQCYEIWKWGTCTVYVRSDSKTIARLGVATNLTTLGLDSSYIGVIKLVYDGTKWLATLHRTE